jgi:hypothetical protein
VLFILQCFLILPPHKLLYLIVPARHGLEMYIQWTIDVNKSALGVIFFFSSFKIQPSPLQVNPVPPPHLPRAADSSPPTRVSRSAPPLCPQFPALDRPMAQKGEVTQAMDDRCPRHAASSISSDEGTAVVSTWAAAAHQLNTLPLMFEAVDAQGSMVQPQRRPRYHGLGARQYWL